MPGLLLKYTRGTDQAAIETDLLEVDGNTEAGKVLKTDSTGKRFVLADDNESSGGSGQTAQEVQNAINAAPFNVTTRYRRTHNATSPPSPPTSTSDGTWHTTYTAPNSANQKTWVAFKIHHRSAPNPDDATGWTVAALDELIGLGQINASGSAAGKVLKVDSAGTGLEWADDATASGGSGLDQPAVDARVRALVADWAEQGNASTLPNAKIAANAITSGRIASNAVTKAKMADDSVGIAELDATGTTAGSKVLKTNAAGNTLTWADDETGQSAGDVRGLIAAAKGQGTANEPLEIGYVDGNGNYIPDDQNLGKAEVGTRNLWADTGHRHPWREKEAEVFNAFDGNAWEPTTLIQFAVVSNRIQWTQNRPTFAQANAYTYTATPDDVTPAPLPNQWFTWRTEEINAARSDLRVNLDTSGEDNPNPATINLDAIEGARFREIGRGLDSRDNKRYVYYSDQPITIPAGTQFGGEAFDKFEVNLSKLSITNLARAIHAEEGPGTTVLINGPGAGLSLNTFASDHRTTSGVNPILFSPALDLDDVGAGEILWSVDLRLTARGSTSYGFSDDRGVSHSDVWDISGVTFTSAILASTVYATNAANGVLLAERKLFDATTETGTLSIYLTRVSNGEVGYYFDYDAVVGSGTNAHASLSSTVRMAYKADSSPASSGGGGTASLDEYTPAADVTAPWGSAVNAYGAWTDVISHTITNAQAGLLGLDAQSHIEYPEAAATTIGGARIWAEERLLHTRGATETTIARTTTYLRNVNIAENIDKERYLNIAAWHQCQIGDIIKVQGRVARQNTAVTGTGIRWNAADTKLQVVKFG